MKKIYKFPEQPHGYSEQYTIEYWDKGVRKESGIYCAYGKNAHNAVLSKFKEEHKGVELHRVNRA